MNLTQQPEKLEPESTELVFGSNILVDRLVKSTKTLVCPKAKSVVFKNPLKLHLLRA